MEKKPYYVMLTGGKNNAGDFMIKYRAFELMKRFRPDRDIVDVDAWHDRTDALLETFNGAKAIILTGGPSLRPSMYPDIYRALGNLDDIKVPILTMAVGWRAFPGEWHQTYNYALSEPTLKLLKKIEASGYRSSVRDYHTLNVLINRGFKSFMTTGCAVLFDLDYAGKPYVENEIGKVAFSLGVSFVQNSRHEAHMKEMIRALRNKYQGGKFDVAFHHSLGSRDFSRSYEGKETFYKKHAQFAEWLTKENISFTDISGSAENLINYYSGFDLHIGYRVHAHIFMCSVNRRSILIAEDGRGKALRDTINGLVLDNEFSSPNMIEQKGNKIFRIARRLNLLPAAVMPNKQVAKDLINNLNYEYTTGFSRVKRSRAVIDDLLGSMEFFLKQLP
jgi:hypothetical protein